jgi:hypothetical protein
VADLGIRGTMHFAHTRADGRTNLVGSQASCGSRTHKALNDFILL